MPCLGLGLLQQEGLQVLTAHPQGLWEGVGVDPKAGSIPGLLLSAPAWQWVRTGPHQGSSTHEPMRPPSLAACPRCELCSLERR